jgi:hypothetical protein
MLLQEMRPDGTELWYCPACGRSILLRWPPDYEKITLSEGDMTVGHSGGKGGLEMGMVQVVPGDGSDPGASWLFGRPVVVS